MLDIDVFLIQEGVYKNYNDLCLTLGIKPMRGNTQVAVLKEISRFWEYTKEGHKYIFTKLKDEVDMVAIQRNSVWLTSTVVNVLRYLAAHAPSDDGVNRVFIEKHKLYTYIGLCNMQFYKEKNDYLDGLEGINIDSTDINSLFYDTVSRQMYKVGTRLIQHIRTNYAQTAEDRYSFIRVGSKEVEISSFDMTAKITDILDQEAKKVGCMKLAYVYKSRSKDEFNANSKKRLKEELGITFVKKGVLFAVTNYTIKQHEYAEQDLIEQDRALANKAMVDFLLTKGRRLCDSILYQPTFDINTKGIISTKERQDEAYVRYTSLVDSNISLDERSQELDFEMQLNE